MFLTNENLCIYFKNEYILFTFLLLNYDTQPWTMCQCTNSLRVLMGILTKIYLGQTKWMYLIDPFWKWPVYGFAICNKMSMILLHTWQHDPRQSYICLPLFTPVLFAQKEMFSTSIYGSLCGCFSSDCWFFICCFLEVLVWNSFRMNCVDINLGVSDKWDLSEIAWSFFLITSITDSSPIFLIINTMLTSADYNSITTCPWAASECLHRHIMHGVNINNHIHNREYCKTLLLIQNCTYIE